MCMRASGASLENFAIFTFLNYYFFQYFVGTFKISHGLISFGGASAPQAPPPPHQYASGCARHIFDAMATTFFPKVVGKTLSTFMQFKSNLVNMVTLLCRCARRVFRACWTKHCHDKHIFAESMRVEHLQQFSCNSNESWEM